MAGFFSLVLLGIFMFITCIAVQVIPLKTNLAPCQLNNALSLSVGMLVGTALALVVPEGVELLIEGQGDFAWKVPFLFAVGAPILLGFVVMYLLDHHQIIQKRFFPHTSTDKHDISYIKSIILTPLTFSLILHSLVDGFALGVSSQDELLSVHYIFYTMIILHKLPTAFSLSVVLIQQGLPQNLFYVHILAFALTTPLASLISYPFAKLALASHVGLALLLLFSSGTFLYSVVHLFLQEPALHDHGPVMANSANYFEPDDGLDFVHLLLTVGGTLIPLVFSLAGVD